MFFEIVDASANLGCYYGGVAFWTVAWICIYVFYACLIWKITRFLGKKTAEGLTWLKGKLKREKDVQEKETEE